MDRRTLALTSLSALLILGIVAGCTSPATSTDPPAPPAEEPSDVGGDPPAGSDAVSFAWADFELTDAITGEAFTLKDFAGTQVYVQAFAVW